MNIRQKLTRWSLPLTWLLSVYFILPKSGTWFYLHDCRWLYVFLISFLFSYSLTPIVIFLARRYKLLDYPDERKIHRVPVPRLGSIAVILAFILAITRNLQFSLPLIGIVSGAVFIFALGLLDDLRGVPAKVRLGVQILVVFILLKCGVMVTFIPNWPGSAIVEMLITAVWIIGITNAMNFLDGIDGLVAGLGVISCVIFLAVILQMKGGPQVHLQFITIALGGSCLGFLPYNFKPARIFLGDAGSTLIGFLLASVAVMGSWSEDNPMVALSTPVLILGVAIFDMVYITASRIKNGAVKNFREWLDYVGRDHLHHRLLSLGLTERQAVSFIYLISICLGISAILIRQTGTLGSILLLSQAVGIFLIVVVLMLIGRKVKF
jgi:UDP-GlcNAc:undecaprenyl-phosphate GlcNAc-1-phosphate transferase